MVSGAFVIAALATGYLWVGYGVFRVEIDWLPKKRVRAVCVGAFWPIWVLMLMSEWFRK